MKSNSNSKYPTHSLIQLLSLSEERLEDTSENEIIESYERCYDYNEHDHLFSSIGHEETRKATLTPGPVYCPKEGPIRRTPGAGERPGLVDINERDEDYDHLMHLDRMSDSSDRSNALQIFSDLSPRLEKKSSFGDDYSLQDLVQSIHHPHMRDRFSSEGDELYSGPLGGGGLFSDDRELHRINSYDRSTPLSKAIRSLQVDKERDVNVQSQHSGLRKHYSGSEDGGIFLGGEVERSQKYDDNDSIGVPSLFSPGKNVHSIPFYPQHLQQQHPFQTESSNVPDASRRQQHQQQPQTMGYSSHQHSNHIEKTKYGQQVNPPPGYEPIYHQQRNQGRWGSSQHSHPPPVYSQQQGYGTESKLLYQYPNDNRYVSSQQQPHATHVQQHFHQQRQSQGDIVGAISGSETKDSSKRSKSPKSRQEQVESPVSKSIYKNFVKVFKSKEGESVVEAVAYAKSEIPKIPEKVKWRALIDVADTLKRNSRYDDARYMYAKVCREYPSLNQGWLEWSKMEEECGHLEESLKILRRGARTNKNSEVLLTKAIKQHERLNNIGGAREMLGRLQNGSIEVIWRTVLEGALLESRAGNIAVARKLLTALIRKVPWYGPVYQEAFRLEEKADLYDRALTVVEKGLAELPRYGPLWFGKLRLMERRDMMEEASRWTSGDEEPRLTHTRAECEKAVCSISKELVWKIHFEQAQTEERAAEIVALGRHLSTGKPLMQCRHELFANARQCFTQSLMTCPPNLRWKVYLAGARMELSVGQTCTAKLLLRQAHAEVPEKSKYHVWLECSRLEEFQGNINASRKILLRARRDIKNEWKIFLETVLVEARAGNVSGAVYLADKALTLDSGSGRLWALVVQLSHRIEWRGRVTLTQATEEILFSGLDRTEYSDIIPPSDYEVPSKYTILSRALQVVPKSGEVWCEGARTLLNPLCPSSFDLGKAQKYLAFAIQFTPQYGDSFIEYVRLEMLIQVVLPRVLTLMGVPWSRFMHLIERYDTESDSSSILEKGERGLQELRDIAYYDSDGLWHDAGGVAGVEKRRENMHLVGAMCLDIGYCTEAYKHVKIDRLYRRCVNADPNYGTAWFFCRTRPYDTPGTVLRSAHSTLVHDFVLSQEVYATAVAQYVQKVLAEDLTAFGDVMASSAPIAVERTIFTDDFEVRGWLQDFQNMASSSPGSTLHRMISGPVALVETLGDGCNNSGTTFSSQDFITALIKLNRVMYTRNISAEERRRMLFGVDQITP